MIIRCEDVLDALRHCRTEDGCIGCPLQAEICDELIVEMEEVPAELLDLIEQVLGQRSI